MWQSGVGCEGNYVDRKWQTRASLLEELAKIVPEQLLVWEIMAPEGSELYKLILDKIHLELVWNSSSPSEVPYSTNQQLARNYFLSFLTANGL